ncbi:methyltransferase domain-containing protein [Microbulbifer rhizosphaerae]|uniref:SAM-dependent methyltransferase/BMFP domain-containing protein YqiC n=1 Tax=Microbulbifer rhizosphaerae TaxID=1562603 RepID=A0A7W4Z9D7_9GAMM|nr:methyltransferase domain-containing protein [Microbulbifer rhizosphaerae]MBB3061481.1 SAM-dependent methyltransferase/BMFP domain-containing protein YqiC [Microbulbifer rhizosphaerae]
MDLYSAILQRLKRFLIKIFKIGESTRKKFAQLDKQIAKLESSRKKFTPLKKRVVKLESTRKELTPLKKRVVKLESTRKEFTPLQKRVTKLEEDSHIVFALDQNASRERLITLADQLPANQAKISIVRHLFRLRNFKSACKAAKGLDLHKQAPRNLFLIIRCFLSGTEGVQADSMLDWFLRHHDLTSLPEGDQRTLADLIYLSGAEPQTKLSRLAQLSSAAASDKIRQYTRFQKFRIKLLIDTKIDPLNYAELDQLDVEEPSYQLRYIPHLKALGYDDEAKSLLDCLYRHHGMEHAGVLSAILTFDADWPRVDLAALPKQYINRLEFLQLANDHKGSCEEFSSLFDQCLQANLKVYPNADVYLKDKILNRFLRLDLLDEIEQLVSSDRELPDTVLSPHLATGLYYFMADQFLSARDRFMRVMEEDPSDPVAAQGLRLALPRAGGDMSSIITIRDRLGYGIRGAGRTGSCANVGSDKVIGNLMSGHYREGLYAKRHATHWQLLKRIYGDRFFNFERLPVDSKAKHLFVIGDEGVGDEVRTSQFYAYLTERFNKVTITCDPRLTEIFKRSFPQITFIPVERYRKGLTRTATSKKKRISGLNMTLSQILTDDCKPLMDQADYITFGQNLFFNRFIGEIPRLNNGGYLSSTKEKRTANKKLRVGILWRSHFISMWRKFMYLKVEDFTPLTELETVELWSMQHCITDEEKNFCRAKNIRLVEDVDLFDDFEGMVPILKHLDLMIGISSLPIELAAALGTPVWMLGFSPENYFLRTGGGTIETDQLTTNSTIVAPEWIDFSAPSSECVTLVMEDVCRRLRRFEPKPLPSSSFVPEQKVETASIVTRMTKSERTLQKVFDRTTALTDLVADLYLDTMPLNDARNAQERAWLGRHGFRYVVHHLEEKWEQTRTPYWEMLFSMLPDVSSVCEFGCNIGANLRAINHLRPNIRRVGIEINAIACEVLRKSGIAEVHEASVSEIDLAEQFDLVFSRGVLIHINPSDLENVLRRMAKHSKRYVLIYEIFSPEPFHLESYSDIVSLATGEKAEGYQFWRDFASEFSDLHPAWQIVRSGVGEMPAAKREDAKPKHGKLVWTLFKRPDALLTKKGSKTPVQEAPSRLPYG